MPPALWESYVSLLPSEMQIRNNKFLRWQDRHSHLFGKLLLLRGLKAQKIDCQGLCKLQSDNSQRPFLPDMNIDFNISHSGKYVLCAMSKQLKVGIDIEEHKEVSLNDLSKVMTPDQWRIIYSASEPLKMFYRFWSIKESVIKADGCGLKIPLDQLQIDKNTVVYDNKLWNIMEFTIDDRYSSALATDKPCEYHIKWIDFYDCEQVKQTITS